MAKTQNATMAILEGEKAKNHRAFLLYAMQSPTKRSLRCTAQAIGVSTPSICDWKEKFEWEKRMKSAGPAHDAIAQRTYQELYFAEIGMREIIVVEKRIINVQSIISTTTKEIGSAVQETVKESQALINADRQETRFDDQMKAKHLDLVDRSIQYISDALQNGDVKVTLKDLPTMLELRDSLTGKAKDNENKGSVLIETIRVKDAKANGGDLIGAMLEDSKELVAIFSALCMQGKHPSNLEDEKEDLQQA